MRYILYIFLFVFFLSGKSQVLHPRGLSDYELELSSLGERIIIAKTEEERLKVNAEFKDLLREALGEERAISYSFEKVKNLSKQTLITGKLRLFTWVVPLKDGTYQYHGLALYETKKDGMNIRELEDKSVQMKNPEYQWLKTSNWYGAVYYDVIEVKHKKKRYFVLLGYRPGTRKIQEKLLEVVTFENDIIRFGAKIFETPKISDYKYKQRPYRLLFPYSKKITASIKWNEELDMIVMDHLSPPDAKYKGQWEYYGPDFSYDAFYWKKGKWHLKEMVEFDTGIKTTIPEAKPKQGLGE